MNVELDMRFNDRELIIDKETYRHINGECHVSFDRDDLSFNCDYCKLSNINSNIKEKAELKILRQLEAFVLAYSVASKNGKDWQIEYKEN